MATVWSWSSSASTEPETFTGSAPTIDTAGTYGERYLWPATTAPAYARKTISIAANFAFRFIYSVASFSSASHMVFSGNDSAATYQLRVDLSGGGLLRLRADSASGGTQVQQGTVPLVAGTEYRFEILRSGTTATVKAYKVSNNSLVDTVSGTVGSAALIQVLMGNNAAVTGTLGAFSFDEMVLNDNANEVGVVPSALAATATVSPASVGQGSTLTLVINATGGTGSYSYSVSDWGDGTSSPAQTSNTFTKAIASNAVLGSKTISWSVTG